MRTILTFLGGCFCGGLALVMIIWVWVVKNFQSLDP